jgi:uncharacterized protein DUF2752
MELFRPCENRRPLKGQLSWFIAWVAVTGIAAVLTPDAHGHGTHQQLGLPPCPSVLLFDRPCPGCGLTTSWTALMHGQFGFAFHAHPLGPLLYAMFTALAWLSLYGWVTRRMLMTDTPKFNRVAIAAVTAFLAFGLVRMAITPHFATQNERLLVDISRQFGTH